MCRKLVAMVVVPVARGDRMSLFRRASWVLVCGGSLGLVGVVPEVG